MSDEFLILESDEPKIYTELQPVAHYFGQNYKDDSDDSVNDENFEPNFAVSDYSESDSENTPPTKKKKNGETLSIYGNKS